MKQTSKPFVNTPTVRFYKVGRDHKAGATYSPAATMAVSGIRVYYYSYCGYRWHLGVLQQLLRPLQHVSTTVITAVTAC